MLQRRGEADIGAPTHHIGADHQLLFVLLVHHDRGAGHHGQVTSGHHRAGAVTGGLGEGAVRRMGEG
ncbi:MAG TPA: hypothetical protein VGV86_11820 [Acidimicrobiales bacterium]|nr:hypothetical protein [Acidimicrobiales bacterium]